MKPLRLYLLFMLCCCMWLCSIPAEAKVWTATDVPMVHLQDQNRYVCDPDGLLSNDVRDSADVYLRRLQLECGIQTVFVVVEHVKDGDCFRMAQDIGNHYGVGTKKDRKGLVVVIAVGDRRYFIAPGKGLEGELTDVECDDIAQRCIVSNMKVNDINQAVLSTTKAFLSKFKQGHASANNESRGEKTDDITPTAVFFLLLCFGYPLYLFVVEVLRILGICKPKKKNHRHDSHDDWFPPFIFGGGGGFGGSGGFGGGSSGGSFGGGSFGGGGAGGGW